MLRSIRASAIAVVMATVLATGTAASASAAIDRPASAPSDSSFASLRGVVTKIATGKSARFTYTVKDLASGETAQLQRTFGAARTWGRVLGLAAKSNASVTAPALGGLGAYAYRVAIIKAGKVVKATRPSITVYVYGNVPLSPLPCPGDCPGTVQVGNTVFSYTSQTYTDVYPNYLQYQAFTATSCRSLTVRYAGDGSAQNGDATSYLEFVQASSDPVYASTPGGTVGSVTVALDGGPLYIDTASSAEGFDVGIDFNITGSCWTLSGIR